jgi:outer membrane protein assembly factor BamB
MHRIMLLPVALLLAGHLALAQTVVPVKPGQAAPLQSLLNDPAIRPSLQRGLVLEIGSRDSAFAIQLAHASGMKIHRVIPEAAGLAANRAAIEAAGLSAPRIRVEAGPLAALAFPNFAFNAVFAAAFPATPAEIGEMGRLIHPGGWLLVSGDIPADIAAAKSRLPPDTWLQPRMIGLFLAVQRAPQKGAAEWTHHYRDPDNNRYSPDKLIRPPLRILWYGEPCYPLGDLLSTQSLTAGGRLFMTDAFPDDTTRARLTCLNAYNGFKLWERAVGAPRIAKFEGTKNDTLRAFQMPGWVRPGDMAVSADRIYITDGPDCLILDGVTGRDLTRFKAPPPTHPSNCWRFVAYQGDLLFGYADAPVVMPGTKPPLPVLPGGPPTIFALNLANGAPVWARAGAAGEELGASFGTPLAIGEERIFIRADATSLLALDTRTGKTMWKASVVEDPAPDKATWWEGVVHRGNFLLSKYNMRSWGDKKKLTTLTYGIADGRLLSEVTTNLEKEVFWNSKEDLLSSPPRPRLGCNYGSAAGPFQFLRNNYMMEKTNAVPGSPAIPIAYGGVRAACGVGVLPANGLAHILPNGLGCGCGAYHATVTLEPGLEVEKFAPGSYPAAEINGKRREAPPRPAASTDWPTFMADPQRSSLTRQDLSQPRALGWEVRIPGDATPCIAVGQQVFLGSTVEAIYALDAANGRVQWKFHTSGPVRTAPAYWNGLLYVGCDDGYLYCLDAATGELAWRLRAGPSARQQVAFETLISAWPLRHGLAIEDGQIFFSAGFLPGNEIYAYAADARTGKVGWSVPLGRSSIIPCGYLVVKPKAIMYPSPGASPIYHPVFQSRADGSRQGGGTTHADFTECRFVPGLESDEAGYRQGFLVHGGDLGIQRGYRQGVGYNGRVTRFPISYGFFQEVPGPPPSKPKLAGRIGDGASFLPLFTATDVFFRIKGALACVPRTDIMKYTDIYPGKGDERDGLYKWRTTEIPCGEPQWLLAATGARAGDPVTLLAGGPKGIAAFNAADGKVLWTVAGEGATLPAAVANGKVYASTLDGRVHSLETGK